MLRLPWTVDATFTAAFVPAHDSSRKAWAIFFITLCLLARAEDLILLFDLIDPPSHHFFLLIYAALAAESGRTYLVFGVEALASVPFALSIALAGMSNQRTNVLWFTLWQSTAEFERLVCSKVFVCSIADSQTSQRLFLQRSAFLEQLVIYVGFSIPFQGHNSG